MRVIVENVEIRGYEIKKSQSTNNEYGVVFFEEHTGRAGNVLCRDLDLVRGLEKGNICNLACDLVIAKYTKFELVSTEIVS